MSHGSGPDGGPAGDDGRAVVDEDLPLSPLVNRLRTSHVFALVSVERERQHQQWGVQRHDFAVWLTVLMEEVGEVSAALLRLREWDAGAAGRQQDIEDAGRRHRLRRMREEAVQVAAVAVVMIEHMNEVLDA